MRVKALLRCFSFAAKIKPKLSDKELDIDRIVANCKLRGRPFDKDKYYLLHSQQDQLSSKVLELTNINESTQSSDTTKRKLIKETQNQLKQIKQELNQLILSLPNETSPHSPIGKEGSILEQFGINPPHNNSGLDHVDVGKRLDIFDLEQSAKIIGSKWIYLKHNGAILENALVQYTLQKLIQKKFQLIFPPDVADIAMVTACGYNPRESGAETLLYQLERSELVLAATSEILLAGFHAGSRLPIDKLPIRYAAMSHCFRPEVGHYGKSSRGLYRIHQFTKVEMFAYSTAVQSEDILNEFVGIQKEIVSELGLHGRVVEIGTWELGNSAYRKIDIEVEMPMRGEWGEVSSASNCTNYQTNRLCIGCFDKEGKRQELHTLNATALAVPRIIQALIENYYCKESDSIKIPTVLLPFSFGISEIKRINR